MSLPEEKSKPKALPALARLLHRHSAIWAVAAWIVVSGAIAFYAWRMVGIGLDLRQDYWVYWRPNNFLGDIDNAMHMADRVLREANQLASENPDGANYQSNNARGGAAKSSPRIFQPGVDLLTTPIEPKVVWERLKYQSPLYWQIVRGWVAFYEDLEKNPNDPDRGLDYPPLRLMTMTLWTWHVQSHFPGMRDVPANPRVLTDAINHRRAVADVDIVQPVLEFNTFCDAASATAMFLLVCIWADRRHHQRRWFWIRKSSNPSADSILDTFERRRTIRRMLLWPTAGEADLIASDSWRAHWGDPLLIIPVVLLGLVLLFWNNISWVMIPEQVAAASALDARTTRLGWWVLLALQYVSVVCLARLLPRPYRGPVCAMIAATIIWVNPASLLDSAAWPQWDLWLPPFFLWAALLISLNCWALAGAMLGVGCMFKGQLLFVSPVIVLCPLLAGWPWKFVRLVAGLMAAAGIVVAPFLFDSRKPIEFIAVCVGMALLFCLLSIGRRPAWQQLKKLHFNAFSWWRHMRAARGAVVWIVTLVIAAILLGLAGGFSAKLATEHWRPSLVLILAIAIVAFPWLAPRRLIPGWILTVFAASIWIAAAQFNGKTSWWDIGFIYGTQKHPVMQLGEHSLSNLSSIMHERYLWELHDHVLTLNWPPLPPAWRDFDVQKFQGLIYGIAAILCSIGAAMHFRRRDPRFLIALAAPWILFVTLLTQMASRYTPLPALFAAGMLGISVGMSLFPAIMTLIGFAMLGNQMLERHPATAPITVQITRGMYPDIAWLMLMLAAIFLYGAIVPGARQATQRRELLEGTIA